MEKIFVTAVIFIGGLSAFPQKDINHGCFFENFNRSASRNFQPHTGGKGADSPISAHMQHASEFLMSEIFSLMLVQ